MFGGTRLTRNCDQACRPFTDRGKDKFVFGYLELATGQGRWTRWPLLAWYLARSVGGRARADLSRLVFSVPCCRPQASKLQKQGRPKEAKVGDVRRNKRALGFCKPWKVPMRPDGAKAVPAAARCRHRTTSLRRYRELHVPWYLVHPKGVLRPS